jgi:hypothetical protein
MKVLWKYESAMKIYKRFENRQVPRNYTGANLFGTDLDRNRALEKPPGVELIPCRRKPLRRTRLLRNPAQTQVWSEQVWLNTTFILQGSRSWDKLAVET